MNPRLFDWEDAIPNTRSLEAFALVQSEKEFPMTYSGQSWRACYRMWKATKHDPKIMEPLGAWDEVPNCDIKELGLSGFMWGWAKNALKAMYGFDQTANPAVLEIGAGEDQPVTPAVGTAEQAMRRAIGGDAPGRST